MYNALAAHNDSPDNSKDLFNDSNMMDVESGVEALEDTLDGFGYTTSLDKENNLGNKPIEINPCPPPPPGISSANLGLPPTKNNFQKTHQAKTKSCILSYYMYILTFILLVNYFLFPKSHIWNGFVLGIWFFCFVSDIKDWFFDNYFSDEPSKTSFFQLKRTNTLPMTYTIPSVKEHTPLKKYEVRAYMWKIKKFSKTGHFRADKAHQA